MDRFFCNDTATTEIYTLSLHDALPIWGASGETDLPLERAPAGVPPRTGVPCMSTHSPLTRRLAAVALALPLSLATSGDRKSTRLNSSHANISYAVFCLKKNQPLLAAPL